MEYIRWLKCHKIVIQGQHKTSKGLAEIKRILNQEQDIVQSS